LLQNSRSRFWKTIIALSLILINLGFVIESIGYIQVEAERNVYRVSEYFYHRVDPNALVETYDSELNFLLRQPIHYPPDKLQVDLNRRKFLGQPISISYNPLDFNSDYLVIGPLGDTWQLYEPFVKSGNFQFIQEFPGYRIYKRAQ
jgi:hypothetical protein